MTAIASRPSPRASASSRTEGSRPPRDGAPRSREGLEAPRPRRAFPRHARSLQLIARLDPERGVRPVLPRPRARGERHALGGALFRRRPGAHPDPRPRVRVGRRGSAQAHGRRPLRDLRGKDDRELPAPGRSVLSPLALRRGFLRRGESGGLPNGRRRCRADPHRLCCLGHLVCRSRAGAQGARASALDPSLARLAAALDRRRQADPFALGGRHDRTGPGLGEDHGRDRRAGGRARRVALRGDSGGGRVNSTIPGWWSKGRVILWVLAIALVAGSLYAAFARAPVEAQMGVVQKIVYIHVPSAIVSLPAFGLTFAASIAFPATRGWVWAAVAGSCSEVGMG